MEVARSASVRGEVVLSRRDRDGALELRVNGIFVMDSVETSTERLLAHRALECLDSAGPLSVLVGGLGLGFTVAAVLSDARVRRVVVVEIEPALVQWHRQGLVPDTSAALGDARVDVQVDDVRRLTATAADSTYDLVLLDVDNGPGGLVHDANAAVYRGEFLRTCRRVTRPGGATVIWSADAAPSLLATMGDVFDSAEELALPVRLGQRETTYRLFVGRLVDPH